jgi:hypothetical protein
LTRTQELAEINHFTTCPIGTLHHGQIEVKPLIGSPQILAVMKAASSLQSHALRPARLQKAGKT